MTKKRQRVCIYIKDVMILTGKSERTVRLMMMKIRKSYGKRRNALITVQEFANYMNINEDYLLECLV